MKNFLILILFTQVFFNQSFSKENFPVKGEMKTRVSFWIKVYTEAGTNQVIAHDVDDLSIVYNVINTPSNRRKKRKFLRQQKVKLKNIIISIAKKNYLNLNSEENRVAKILGERTAKELYRLSRNFRFQGGLKDRYLVGLKNSYKYLDYIQSVFSKQGIPKELSYLPHVESSFNYKAYSKVGAAGIWQFMRSTGRLYKLKINYVIDERRDPIKATYAAARLLKDNYRLLGRWPLALTAYNHGPQSIKRAIKKVGSKDINQIIENYNGRRFGFASKNFYATFMATVIISKRPYIYFPQFKKPKPFLYTNLKLPKPLTISQITKALKINSNKIKDYNYDIRASVYRSNLLLPRNYRLKIPVKYENQVSAFELKLKLIKNENKGFDTERIHIVSRGENLFDISRIHRVKMRNIIHFNQIMDPSKIYPGMKIKIPGTKSKIVKVSQKNSIKHKEPAEIKVATKEETKTQDFLTGLFTKLTGEKAVSVTNTNTIPLYKTDPIIHLKKYNLDLLKVSSNIYSITVETEETLGHYSDWSLNTLRQIRRLNSLRRKGSINIGRKINIKLNDNKVHDFKLKRNEYHLSIQEDFYNNFIVSGKKVYKIRRGDSISLILKKFKIPYWLLRQYQTTQNFTDKLFVGQKIIIPEVESTNDDDVDLNED